MFKKNTVSTKEMHIKKNKEEDGLCPLQKILFLLGALAEETCTLPLVYPNSEKTSLRVQFPESCVEIREFIESYGALLGEIGENCPITVNGLVNKLEEGTISVETETHEYCFKEHSASGHEFETLSHLYLKITPRDTLLCEFIEQALKNFHRGQSFIAMPRKWDAIYKNLFQGTDVLYFRYLPLSQEPADVYEELPNILSVEQITELWMRFLQGGASWAEFETVQELAAGGNYEGLYKWELALKLAIENLGITIDFSDTGVHAYDKNGERIKIGYNSSTGVEKLFAKIISPA